MRRTTARGMAGVERFPADTEVAELSEEWAVRALDALRVAAVSRNGRGSGGERGDKSDRWPVCRCPQLE